MTTEITGREPRISGGYQKKGERRLSLRRLGTMLNMLPPHAVSLDALVAAIRSDEFFVRYNAARLLSKRGDRDARLIAEDVLSGDHPRARASVARQLHGFSWYSAEPLLRKAFSDEDYRVREAAIYSLCDLHEYNGFMLMCEALENEVDSVREAAAFGLRNSRAPEAVPVLELCLHADDPDVRVKALEALGQNDTMEARPVVRNAINDPEPIVKYAATLSLLELAGEDWLDELSGIIGRTNGIALEQILRGFFHATNYLHIDVGKTKAADLLIDALETALLDDLAATRQAVIWPLAWMRHMRTPEILRRSYTIETEPQVKAEMVRITTSLMADNAGATEAEKAVAAFILDDALQSSDAAIRETAERVIRNFQQAPSGNSDY